MLQIAFPESGFFYFASALCFAMFATGWATFDARSRGSEFLPVVRMLYFFLWPLGFLIYLMYRSGFRGLLTTAVYCFGFMATLFVSTLAAFFCLFFAGLLDPSLYR